MRTDKTPYITPAQLKVLNIIDEYGAATLVKALHLVHSATIYHTLVELDNPTREELFYIQELMDAIGEVAKGE